MKKALAAVMATALTLSSGLTAFAAPEIMSDGTVFDAEYYAQNNPDVVAVFGTDKNALYQHYLNFGKAEGRQAYGESADSIITNGQGMTLPYFTIIRDDEPTYVTLSMQRDDLFHAREGLIDASAGINGNTFTISSLYLPDNYLEFIIGTDDPFVTPCPIAYDFNIGLIYSPQTEDFIPKAIVFEPDGGIIYDFVGNQSSADNTTSNDGDTVILDDGSLVTEDGTIIHPGDYIPGMGGTYVGPTDDLWNEPGW